MKREEEEKKVCQGVQKFLTPKGKKVLNWMEVEGFPFPFHRRRGGRSNSRRSSPLLSFSESVHAQGKKSGRLTRKRCAHKPWAYYTFFSSLQRMCANEKKGPCGVGEIVGEKKRYLSLLCSSESAQGRELRFFSNGRFVRAFGSETSLA